MNKYKNNLIIALFFLVLLIANIYTCSKIIENGWNLKESLIYLMFTNGGIGGIILTFYGVLSLYKNLFNYDSKNKVKGYAYLKDKMGYDLQEQKDIIGNLSKEVVSIKNLSNLLKISLKHLKSNKEDKEILINGIKDLNNTINEKIRELDIEINLYGYALKEMEESKNAR